MANPTKTTDLTKPNTSTDAALVSQDDYFEALETTPQDPGSKEVSPSYVGMLHGKTSSQLADQLKAAGVTINQFYLARNGAIIPLNPFKYRLLESEKFFTKQDASGKIIEVRTSEPGPDVKGFSEHGFALILVELPSGELVPARFQCRGGQYQCLKAARQMQDMARDAKAFGAMGDTYKVAATLPLPARFVVTASARMEKSASTGFDFIKGQCTTMPAKITDGEAFLKFRADPGVRKEFDVVRAAYSRNVSILRSRVKS